MLNIFFLVLPIFLILISGNLLIRFSLITADFISVSNRLVFYFCLPVLLFYQISTSQFNEVFSLRLIFIMASAVSVMFVLSFVLAFLLKYPKTGAGTFAMNNFRANYAYMGLPVCLSAYGDQGLAIGSIFMAFIVPYVNTLSVLSLAISGSMKFDWKLFLKNTLLNPIALSCLAGIFFSIYSVPFPPFISKTLEIISGVTLPLALFAIGAGTNFRLLRGGLHIVSVSTVMKLIGLPLIALLFLNLTHSTIALPERVMLIMLAAPCATVNYVLASVMEGDTDIAAGTIVATTSLSIFSFVGWLHYLSV